MTIIHPSGTDLKVWVEALSTADSTEYKSTVASLTAFGSTNGGTPAALAGVTAAFNTDMDMFLVTIPANQLPANGNNFFAVVDWEGIIDVKIEAYITDVSSLATSAEITALSSIAAVGAEKIVPADKYTFNASAKTLTFASPYDTLTVEQVTFIKNLTTNYIIWDCRYAGYQTLPIRFGAAPSTHVLSFDSADLDAANTDKIMIVVNQV